MTTFQELGLSDRLCEAIADMGWEEPTPVQQEAIPEGLAGRDMFAQAQTGTGKTGAYALILLGRIGRGNERPKALVLTPTRELADQVSKEMRKLTRVTRHRVIAVYGGANMGLQIDLLGEGCDVVVGTPGRVIDMCERGVLDLSDVRELVLDEADRMLDMGFIDDMRDIIARTPEDRQTLMFSATISDEVRGIMTESMRDPLEISLSHDEVVSDLVTQYWVGVSRLGKMDSVMDIVTHDDPKTVIFCSTKRMVDDLCLMLTEAGITNAAIHGDLQQRRRERTIQLFRNNRVRVLVATDVAARGLDIDDIECVINYDAPSDPESYTHRIGRAGRAGRTGVAVTFVTPREDWRVRMYEQYMDRKIERVAKRELIDLPVSNPELKNLHANDRRDRDDGYRRNDRRRERTRRSDGETMARVVRTRNEGYDPRGDGRRERREYRDRDEGYRHEGRPRDRDNGYRDDRRRDERPRYDRRDREEGRWEDRPRRDYREDRPRKDYDERPHRDYRDDRREDRPYIRDEDRPFRKYKEPRVQEHPETMETVTISLDIGKKNIESRTEVLEYITSCSGVRADRIGRITVSNKVTYVDVESSLVGRVMTSIVNNSFDGRNVRVNFAPQKTKYKDRFGKD